MNELIFNRYKLVNIRRENNITTKQLGRFVGVVQQTISSWENGTYIPSRDNVAKLASIFQVPIDYFFSKEERVDESKNETALKDFQRIDYTSRITNSIAKLDDKHLETLALVAESLVSHNKR